MGRDEFRALFFRLCKWTGSALVGAIPLPGWLAIVLAIFLGVPAWSEAVHFWLDTAKTMGGTVGAIAPILTNPYFPPALAVFGLLYLVVVGFSGSDVVRHKIVPVFGWMVVGVCLVTLFVVAGWGYFELRVREEATKVALGIPRNTPDLNNPNNPQKPLFSEGSSGRILTPDQIRILISELSKLRGKAKSFPVSTPPNDPEAWGVRLRYIDILRRAGVPTMDIPQDPTGPEDEGLIFEVIDPNNMSDSAHKVLEAFNIANIYLKVQKMPTNINLSEPHEDFLLFIALKPIQWR